jgi:hypothetical protein
MPIAPADPEKKFLADIEKRFLADPADFTDNAIYIIHKPSALPYFDAGLQVTWQF